MMKLVLVCLFMIFHGHVSSYYINFTRNVRDEFTLSYNPPHDTSFEYLHKSQSYRCNERFSTFSTKNFTCIMNLHLREKNISSDWIFLLPNSKDAGSTIKVVNLHNDSITFKFKKYIITDGGNVSAKWCKVVSLQKRTDDTWKNITEMFVKNVNVSRGKSWLTLELNTTEASCWQNKNPASILRVRIKCDLMSSKGTNKSINDYLVFKIPGTITVKVPGPDASSSNSLQPTRHLSHISEATGTTDVIASPRVVSPSLSNLPTRSTQPLSTLILSVTTMQSSSVSSIRSSLHYVSSRSMMYQRTQGTTFLPSSTLDQTEIPSSIVSSTSSSVAVTTRSEAMSSADVPVAGITGGVLGGLVILVFSIVLTTFCFKKQRLAKGLLNSPITSPGGKNQSLIYENTGEVPLPTLSNPVFQEGMYENPEDVHKDKKHQSGVNSVESPAYDRCLIVENPSARSENVKSVYDNVAEQQDENFYKSLDSTKREASAKYQSLLANPGNKKETSADSKPTTPPQEPVYSVLDDNPSNVVNTSSGQAKQPKTGEREPVYNVSEDEANTAGTKNEPDYNILEQSTKSEGKRDPVYSVLEDE